MSESTNDKGLTHEEVRARVATARRGAIDAPEIEAHLSSCEECRDFAAREAATTALLQKLDRRPAPASLRRNLAARLARPARVDPKVTAGARRVGLLVAAALFIGFFALSLARIRRPLDVDDTPLVTEAVNDHLRVLVRDRPLDVESSDQHQVKPWFAGRLDFAPILAFGGDDDFPLEGGAVGWFLDRKCATFVFKRRLHVITLQVFPAQGLSFGSNDLHHVGRIDARETTTRGYHVMLWRDRDLGYALVSDVDPKELETLATKIAGP
jgi:anti-sigma factor RsiW